VLTGSYQLMGNRVRGFHSGASPTAGFGRACRLWLGWGTGFVGGDRNTCRDGLALWAGCHVPFRVAAEATRTRATREEAVVC
jgi:hypothetical protein